MKRILSLALRCFGLTALSLLFTEVASSQSQPLTIEEYEPKSTLVTKEHKVERARFTFQFPNSIRGMAAPFAFSRRAENSISPSPPKIPVPPPAPPGRTWTERVNAIAPPFSDPR